MIRVSGFVLGRRFLLLGFFGLLDFLRLRLFLLGQFLFDLFLLGRRVDGLGSAENGGAALRGGGRRWSRSFSRQRFRPRSEFETRSEYRKDESKKINN